MNGKEKAERHSHTLCRPARYDYFLILKLCAAACAACLALVSPAAFESGETESEAFSISLDSVSFNSIEGIVSLDYARYDPLEDTELLWDMGSIMDYYGKDAFP